MERIVVGDKMNGKINFKCPICSEGDVEVYWWYSQQTREEPEDGGFEITEQKCECEITDEQIEKIMQEMQREQNEIERIERQCEIEADKQPMSDEEVQYLQQQETKICKDVSDCEEIFVGNCCDCPIVEKFEEELKRKDGESNE